MNIKAKWLRRRAFNIDRTREIIGEEIFETIGRESKEQLLRHYKDCLEEFNNEKDGTIRKSKLYYELQLLAYRLEI